MAEQDMGQNAQRIAENVLLLAVARVSMALALPTIGLLFTLYSSAQQKQMDALQEKIEASQKDASDASDMALKLSDRLIAVETKQVQDAATSEKFQAATLTRLDRVQDSIVGLSNTVAALTATLQAVAEDKRARRSP